MEYPFWVNFNHKSTIFSFSLNPSFSENTRSGKEYDHVIEKLIVS